MGRRLDLEIVARGLAPSRRAAQVRITEGAVAVDGNIADKASRRVHASQSIELRGPAPRFVSRAGDKLDAALDHFAIDVGGRRWLDGGASTGGFTDCLLQRGAEHVTAVDVGTDQLHLRLRTHPRVTVRERTDLRTLDLAELGAAVDAIAVDLSFISLRHVVATLAAVVVDDGPVLALVKPQFEAGRQAVSAGNGIITDPVIHHRCLSGVVAAAADVGLGTVGVVRSPVLGSAGNVEFVVHLRAGRPSLEAIEHVLAEMVDGAGTKGP